jgi:hypothetical protein
VNVGSVVVALVVMLVILNVIPLQVLNAQTVELEVLSVTWGSLANPTEVGPGDIGQLSITLRTMNTISSPTITATLELPKGLTSVTGDSKVVTYYKAAGSSIPAGSIIELQFKVRVSDDAVLGTYKAKLVLEYVVEVLYYSRVYTTELYVDIPVNGRPNIKIYSYDTSVSPGRQVLTIGLVNNGTVNAENVVIELLTQPQVYTNITKLEVGDIPPANEVKIPVGLFIPPTLSNTTLVLTTTVTYYGPLGIMYTLTYKNNIYVEQYDKPILNAYLSSNELLSGSSLTTNLTIINSGGIAKNLVVRLTTQQPLQVYGNTLYVVDEIGPNESIVIPVTISSTPTTSYVNTFITVSIDYNDMYGLSGSKSFNIPVVVKPIKDSPLTLDLITKEVRGGDISNLTLKLYNGGNNYLSNLTIQVIPPQNVLLLSEPQVRLGNLNPLSTTYVDFIVRTPYVDSVTYVKISYQVSYSDNLGNYFSGIYDFVIMIKPPEAQKRLVISLEPKSFKALSTGSLSVKVLSNDNVGNVILNIVSSGTPLILSGSNDVLVGSLRFGDERVVEIPYVVTNKPGTYVLTINVRYLDSSGVLRTETYNEVIKVLPTRVSLNISITPTNILSSSIDVLSINISNTGESEVRDLVVSVSVQGTVITLVNSSSKFYIGDISPGDSKYVYVNVRSSYVTTYTSVPITITATYYDTLNQLYSDTYTVMLSVEPRTLVSNVEATINTNELLIGVVNNVSITLRNVGNEVIEGINYGLSVGSAINIIGSSDGYIERLRPGEVVVIKLPVYVALTNQYTSYITINLNYVDKVLGTLKNEVKSFTLLLRGKADIRVTDYVVMPTTVVPGQTFSITLTLVNVGVTPAYSAFIYPLIAGLPLRPTTEERAVYLGNIDVGSTTAATITLQLMNTSERVLRLPITISYLDNLRTPQNTTFEVVIRVGTPINTTQITSSRPVSEGTSNYILIAGGLVVVALIALVIIKKLRK